MSSRTTGLRYLSALFDLCREQGIVEDVRDNLATLSGLMEEDPKFREVLLDPRIGRERKKNLIRRIFAGSVSIVGDFVCLLIDKGREEVLEYAGEEFARILRESRNILVAKVQSAVGLDEAFREELKIRLEGLMGKSIELVEERNEELLGGVRVILGSRMIDASLRARLENMRRALGGGAG